MVVILGEHNMEYIKLENNNGEAIFFEIKENNNGREQRVALHREKDSHFTFKVEEFLDSVASFAHEVGGKLHECKASEVEVEFGVNVDINTGGALSVIIGSSASASMKVKLMWKEDVAKHDRKGHE